jgi:glutamyl-tRNA reductase
MMHDAVQSYLESNDVGSFNIQAIALEGQGEVEDRVNKLYNQLVGRDSWIQAIARADVVFVATHSQGTVVSTQLLARLLDQGLIVGEKVHLSVLFLPSTFSL